MTVQSSLFRKATVPTIQPSNPYERFGLTQNPFPDRPSVVLGSEDPRLNGSIYRADLRQQEEQAFERLLVPTSERPDVRPMAFLMDYATRRGRGIGKTAFLTYQYRRIMSDLGEAMTDGSRVLFATYVLPTAEGRCRKFWQFAQLLAETLTRVLLREHFGDFVPFLIVSPRPFWVKLARILRVPSATTNGWRNRV
jgi:hypothetical protein